MSYVAPSVGKNISDANLERTRKRTQLVFVADDRVTVMTLSRLHFSGRYNLSD